MVYDHDADMEDDDFDYAAAFDFMDGDAVKVQAASGWERERAELASVDAILTSLQTHCGA